MTRLGFIGVVILFSNVVCSGEQVLFEDGRTEWTISIPLDSSPVDIYAANELQRVLKTISGAEFPIVHGDQPPEKNAIIVGSLATSPAVRASADRLNLRESESEQLSIHTLDDNLYLAGNIPRAGLFAVYRFLEIHLGARWFWPGADGEYLPAVRAYRLPPIAMNDSPAFRMRELTPIGWARDKDVETWFGRNLLNGGSRTKELRTRMGFIRGDIGHVVGAAALDFETQPESFALIKGKRRSDWSGRSGCWSQPGFAEQAIDHIVRWAKSAEFDILNAFPADVSLRCECSNCVAERTNAGDESTYWFTYYRELVKRANEQIPHLRFAGLAYTDYKKPPTIDLDWLEYVEFAQYDRCYVCKLDDPSCALNRISMDELNAWREKAPMAIYGYEFDIFSPAVYLPFWNMLADQMKTYRDLDLVRMKSEMFIRRGPEDAPEDIRFMRMRLALYIYCRLAWNPDERVDEILSDWCNYLYGPGASALLEYHKAMADAWDNMGIHIRYFFADPRGTSVHLLSPELIRFAQERFDEAETKINTMSETDARDRCLAQLRIERSLFHHWHEFYNEAQENPDVRPIAFANGFDNVPEVELTDRRDNKGYDPTTVRIYWDRQAIHFRFDCDLFHISRLRPGETGTDVHLWQDDSIELFFDALDGSGVRILAVNPAGGTYDAIGSDISWSPEWSYVTTTRDDGFQMTISIPLAELGIRPEAGTRFRMSLTRNTRPRTVSYPFRFQDLNAGTTFELADK